MATNADATEDGFHAPDRERLREDQELFARYADKHDPVDRDLLVERFMPLARSLASRYLRRDEPFDDIFQVACLGLLKAIDGFDVSRGRAFSSYAVPTILGEIKRHYRDRTWVVHVPRDLLERALAVESTAEELAGRLGRAATAAEIAVRLNMSDEEVRQARAAGRARRTVSIEERRGGDEEATTIGDGFGVQEDGFERVERRATLETLMRCLSERDREVMRLRFTEDLTQDEIGSRLDISQMQVSRVLRAAMERLQTMAASMA
jgi:RNA polymerase sigma-B factor